VSRDAKRSSASVHRTAVPIAVAVEIALPLTCTGGSTGIEDSQLGRSRAGPVADYWQATEVAKGRTAIYRAAVQLSIAIQVEPPESYIGPIDSDLVFRGSTDPATNHWETARLPNKIQAEVYHAAIPKVIAVAIKFPHTSSRIKDTNFALFLYQSNHQRPE